MAKKKKKESKTPFYDKLNKIEKIIIDEYLINGFVQYKAYQAGYPKSAYESARTQSSRLFAKTNFSNAISEKLSLIFADKNKILNELIQGHLKILRAEVDDYFEDDNLNKLKEFSKRDGYAVKSLKKTTTKDGQSLQVELHDKKGSMSELAKLLKLVDDGNKLNLDNANINVYIPSNDRDNSKE
jgi:hypothetical protein